MATTDVVGTPPAASQRNWLGRFFDPTTRGSTQRIEFIAGLTTFVTMAYIIFVKTETTQKSFLAR